MHGHTAAGGGPGPPLLSLPPRRLCSRGLELLHLGAMSGARYVSPQALESKSKSKRGRGKGAPGACTGNPAWSCLLHLTRASCQLDSQRVKL